MQITSSSSTGYNEEADGSQREAGSLALSWSPRIVYIRAEITHLSSPLLSFAVFKENPSLQFDAAIEARRPYRSENSAEVVASLWNSPFGELTEAQRYFLVAWGAVPGVSARVVPLAELAFGIATPGPYYKRWITTCAAVYAGEPVAWCIEVDMQGEQEEVIEIMLSEGNMRHLYPLSLQATKA